MYMILSLSLSFSQHTLGCINQNLYNINSLDWRLGYGHLNLIVSRLAGPGLLPCLSMAAVYYHSHI